MKKYFFVFAAALITTMSQAMSPSIAIVPSSQPQAEEVSNIDHLTHLSHYLLAQDFQVSWINPHHIQLGVILKVKTLQLVEMPDDSIGFEDRWVPYELPFSLLTNNHGQYQLTLPVDLRISYSHENLCGADVDGAGFIGVSLPHAPHQSTFQIKSYAVELRDLELFGSKAPEQIPVISSCF